MSYLNHFIVDKTNKLLSLKELEELYEQLQNNQVLGDIKWHPDQLKKSDEIRSLVDKIQDCLIQNNKTYTRFPTDRIHALLCNDAYREDIIQGNLIEEHWIVHKIFDIKESAYFAVLYLNANKGQIVLAYRGSVVKLKDFFKEDHALCNNINGIILKEVIAQQATCYYVTKEVNELAQRNNYFLSFTGYANGAWLA